MDAIEALLTRTAAPRLESPAPNSDELAIICNAALRAPDHGMLRPWKYLLINGDARAKLGRLFVSCLNPDSDARKVKLANAPLRAPLIIVAVTRFAEKNTIPDIEQVCSTAASIQNMSVAIHALGYSCIWRTGAAASNDNVKLGLGLKVADEIVGYLYVGTSTIAAREAPEHTISDYFSNWE